VSLQQEIQSHEQGFYDSVYVMSHSDRTIRTYKSSINHLRKFIDSRYNSNETEIISKIKQEEIDTYEFLRGFIIHLDKLNIKPKGIRSYLSGVKGYLRYNGIKINSDDFKHTVKIPKLIRMKEIPLTREIILRVLHNANPKLQTSILVLVSSGMRIRELISLKISDIDFESRPTKITIRGNTTKTKQTRETFISEEATKSLKDHLTRYFGWSETGNNEHLSDIHMFGPVTNKGRKSKKEGFNVDSSILSLQKCLRNHVCKIPKLDVNNENGYKAIHFHAFRKYFRTTVGNVCGRDYAEALMGHGFYMDTYYQLSEDKKKEMYLDSEPHLTISNFKEVERKITNLTTKCNDLEKTVLGLKEYLHMNSIEIPTTLK
jgi:integrase